MSTSHDIAMTNELHDKMGSAPPTGQGRVYRMVQGFAADGDEFVLSTTGETLTFPTHKPPSPKRPDPAGRYYPAAGARQDPPPPPPPRTHLLESSPSSRCVGYDATSGPSGAIGGASVGSVVAAVGSGVCVATLSAYALKHHQSRSRNKIAGDKAAVSERVEGTNQQVEATMAPTVDRPDPSEAPDARLAPASNQNDVTAPIPSVVYITEPIPEDDQEPSLGSPLASIGNVGAEGGKEACPELAEEELDIAAMTRSPATLVPRARDNGASSALALHAAAASPFNSTLVRMDSREGVSDFAERLCEVSTALQETMASKGIRLDEKTTLKLAVRRLEKQDQQDFEIAKEMRRYMFEHGERDVDRRQKDRHHKESVDVQREAKGWLMELMNARSMCQAQLVNGVMWSGLAVVCLPVAYQSSVYVLYVYEGGLWGFMTVMGQAILGSCSAPISRTTFFSSLLGPVTYYIPTIPSSDDLVCYAGRLAFGALASVFFGVIRFFPKQVQALVLISLALFQSARLSATYLRSLLFPLAFLLIALALGWSCICWMHCKCATSLKKGDGRSPSNAEVAEALSRFDTIAHWIAILNPLCGLAMLGLVAGLWH